MTEGFIFNSAMEESEEHNIIETLLKGPEYPLPEGLSFIDKDDKERRAIRIKWWDLYNDEKITKNWNDLSLTVPEKEQKLLSDILLTIDDLSKIKEQILIPADKNIFIGHYWMTGSVEHMSDKVVCLDYSIAKEGKLVAYSYNPDEKRQNSNFIHVCSGKNQKVQDSGSGFCSPGGSEN